MDHFRQTNLENWEARVPVHMAPDGYGAQALADDPAALSTVVAYDAPRLGDLAGLRAVHLQCHIGTDTLSLARLGATVTGLDFSPSAIDAARGLAERAGIDARFVLSELYAAPAALAGEEFDLVYTGVGALCWLPDIAGWARVVASLLAPGGRLFVRDCHPMLYTLDDGDPAEALTVKYPYFTTAEPLFFDEVTSYSNPTVELASTGSYSWNHGIGELLTAVLDAGLTITSFAEHDECDWLALPWMVQTRPGHWALPDGRDRVPLMFTLTAVQPA